MSKDTRLWWMDSPQGRGVRVEMLDILLRGKGRSLLHSPARPTGGDFDCVLEQLWAVKEGLA